MEEQRFWLLKTEPEDFSWSDMERESRTSWEGVHNNQALSNLRKTSPNDLAFFYHTGKERAIVGIVRVVSTFYVPQNAKFGCIDVDKVCALKRSVTLEEIKTANELSGMSMLRQPRLSVSEVTRKEWNIIISMSNSELC